MPHAFVRLLVISALATVATGAAGQSLHDSTGASANAPVTMEAASGPTVLPLRFMIPHARSAQFSSGAGGRVTTVISATNSGSQQCDLSVEFYFAFNSDQVPECALNISLAPFLAPGADTANACSRAIPGDRWTLCTASCNPALSFFQGKAIVRAADNCAADLAIDARFYHADVNEDVIAISSLEVASDLDGDSAFEQNDNCTAIANPDQRDTDEDGIGNMCDPDLNNDCIVNFLDLGILKSVFFGTSPDADLNGDGAVNFLDLGVLKQFFFGMPGPSGLQNACQ